MRAAHGFAGFDPRRGSDRAWLFGIATRVFAATATTRRADREATARLGGHRSLGADEIEELGPKEAALVLGVSGVAFRKRLSRARAGLRDTVVPGDVPARKGAAPR